MLLGKHSQEPAVPEVLAYDPYAQIVVNVAEQAYNSVEAEIFNAGALTTLYRNEKLQTKALQKLRGQVNRLEAYLLENLEELDEHAKEIASIFEISLTQTKEVTVTVDFNLTIELDNNDDLDDFIQNLTFNVESGYGNFDSEVTDSYGSVQSWDENFS